MTDEAAAITIETTAPATTEPVTTPDAANDWLTTVPDKFKADGAINAQALYTSYAQLEGRMRDTGLPPKDVGDYTFAYPDGTADEAKIPEAHYTALQQFAFDSGMTQKQFEGMAGAWKNEFDSIRAELAPPPPEKLMETAEAELLTLFGTDAEVDKNLTHAAKALINIVPDPQLRQALSDKLGNDPQFIQALAAFGSTLHEDSAPPRAASMPAQDVSKIIASRAYNNPRDPEYPHLRAQVNAYYQNGGSSIRRV
jgi:hypothetical protein